MDKGSRDVPYSPQVHNSFMQDQGLEMSMPYHKAYESGKQFGSKSASRWPDQGASHTPPNLLQPSIFDLSPSRKQKHGDFSLVPYDQQNISKSESNTSVSVNLPATSYQPIPPCNDGYNHHHDRYTSPVSDKDSDLNKYRDGNILTSFGDYGNLAPVMPTNTQLHHYKVGENLGKCNLGVWNPEQGNVFNRPAERNESNSPWTGRNSLQRHQPADTSVLPPKSSYQQQDTHSSTNSHNQPTWNVTAEPSAIHLSSHHPPMPNTNCKSPESGNSSQAALVYSHHNSQETMCSNPKILGCDLCCLTFSNEEVLERHCLGFLHAKRVKQRAEELEIERCLKAEKRKKEEKRQRKRVSSIDQHLEKRGKVDHKEFYVTFRHIENPNRIDAIPGLDLVPNSSKNQHSDQIKKEDSVKSRKDSKSDINDDRGRETCRHLGKVPDRDRNVYNRRSSNRRSNNRHLSPTQLGRGILPSEGRVTKAILPIKYGSSYSPGKHVRDYESSSWITNSLPFSEEVKDGDGDIIKTKEYLSVDKDSEGSKHDAPHPNNHKNRHRSNSDSSKRHFTSLKRLSYDKGRAIEKKQLMESNQSLNAVPLAGLTHSTYSQAESSSQMNSSLSSHMNVMQTALSQFMPGVNVGNKGMHGLVMPHNSPMINHSTGPERNSMLLTGTPVMMGGQQMIIPNMMPGSGHHTPGLINPFTKMSFHPPSSKMNHVQPHKASAATPTQSSTASGTGNTLTTSIKTGMSHPHNLPSNSFGLHRDGLGQNTPTVDSIGYQACPSSKSGFPQVAPIPGNERYGPAISLFKQTPDKEGSALWNQQHIVNRNTDTNQDSYHHNILDSETLGATQRNRLSISENQMESILCGKASSWESESLSSGHQGQYRDPGTISSEFKKQKIEMSCNKLSTCLPLDVNVMTSSSHDLTGRHDSKAIYHDWTSLNKSLDSSHSSSQTEFHSLKLIKTLRTDEKVPVNVSVWKESHSSYRPMREQDDKLVEVISDSEFISDKEYFDPEECSTNIKSNFSQHDSNERVKKNKAENVWDRLGPISASLRIHQTDDWDGHGIRRGRSVNYKERGERLSNRTKIEDGWTSRMMASSRLEQGKGKHDGLNLTKKYRSKSRSSIENRNRYKSSKDNRDMSRFREEQCRPRSSKEFKDRSREDWDRSKSKKLGNRSRSSGSCRNSQQSSVDERGVSGLLSQVQEGQCSHDMDCLEMDEFETDFTKHLSRDDIMQICPHSFDVKEQELFHNEIVQNLRTFGQLMALVQEFSTQDIMETFSQGDENLVQQILEMSGHGPSNLLTAAQVVFVLVRMDPSAVILISNLFSRANLKKQLNIIASSVPGVEQFFNVLSGSMAQDMGGISKQGKDKCSEGHWLQRTQKRWDEGSYLQISSKLQWRKRRQRQKRKWNKPKL